MSRDLFRGIIRTVLVLCLVASCCETFYFMGELSKNTTNRYNPYYNTSDSYYGSENVVEEPEIIEDSDDCLQDNENNINENEFYY